MPFSSTFQLSSLDGITGFQGSGVAANDLTGTVSFAGDINGDGIEDMIVGAFGANGQTGAAYVVFGRADGFAANLDLSSLNGMNGFRINGSAGGDLAGNAVSSAGDVNNDGIDDLLVGAAFADPNGSRSGAAYVIYGKDTAVDGDFAAVFNLSALTADTGFRMDGLAADDFAGNTVASLGDINGDGIDDIIVGAKYADNGGSYAGSSYVVFGQDGNLGASVNLATLNGANGFRIDGAAPNDRSGFFVAGAGDINDDGINDVLVGSLNANGGGASYIVFGTDAGFAPTLSLSSLTGANGFRMTGPNPGDNAGFAVSAAGDVNGDGIDDLIVGARLTDPGGLNYAGSAYVVFGKTTPFAATFSLGALDGTDGFRMDGSAVNQLVGYSVSAAGDLNGDGVDDLIVSARGANPGGRNDAGASYVVYGRTTAFAATLALSTLNGTTGFRIDGEFAGDQSGGTVVGGGDLNDDGVADLIIGARNADPHGASSGAFYVIYGQQTLNSDPGGSTLEGGDSHDALNGGAGADTLNGNGGRDLIDGAGGDDMLNGGAHGDTLNGGDGLDDILGGDGSDVLNGDDGDDALDGGDGADKLNGGTGADDLIGGIGNDRLSGGDDDDDLTGGDGNDTLEGGAGLDTLTGGLGNDVYILDSVTPDIVVEDAAAGYDIVRAFGSAALADNIEGLELQGSGDFNGVGNALSNNIQGNSGHNLLVGYAGVDTINGNDGDDSVHGGLGNDLLRGGIGHDDFYVYQESLGRPTLETDQIYDFSTAEGDTIHLGFIDAIAGGADDAFTYVGTTFTKHAGEMTLTFAGGVTTLRLDQNGDGKVDYQMKINGDVTGDSGGWTL